ncbi:hypothetical protein AWRI3579_g876 [Hanseniaspora osmophila]|uniref:Uncharacterized protein n=1 Tax=Hanseniaspora osmophila TaxID=56408 RepID=A0A1E5RN41_9ASCO|nr:hypothetical protein AWRI3579_g876 [Hanseniaspora osmophila]
MNFIIFLIAVFFLVLFGLALPYFSNLGTYNIKTTYSNNKKNKDFDNKQRESHKRKKLNFSLNVDSEETLQKKYIVDGKTGLKKRVVGDFNQDPNQFDYDVDELIREDEEEEQRQENLKYRRNKSTNGASSNVEELA